MNNAKVVNNQKLYNSLKSIGHNLKIGKLSSDDAWQKVLNLKHDNTWKLNTKVVMKKHHLRYTDDYVGDLLEKKFDYAQNGESKKMFWTDVFIDSISGKHYHPKFIIDSSKQDVKPKTKGAIELSIVDLMKLEK